MSAKTNIIKRRRRYDGTFKQDAVNRVIRTGKSCAEVAREVGIRPAIVARREAEDLREQRNIFKKALHIFNQ